LQLAEIVAISSDYAFFRLKLLLLSYVCSR